MFFVNKEKIFFKIILSMLLLCLPAILNAHEENSLKPEDFFDTLLRLQAEVVINPTAHEECIKELKQKIWDGKDTFTQEEILQNKVVFDTLAQTLSCEFLPFSMPYSTPFSQTPELYINDPYVHVTVICALQKVETALFGSRFGYDTASYDHVGLVFEYYDEKTKTLKTHLSHLTTTDEWSQRRLLLQRGYANVDYGVRKIPFNTLVAYCIYQYKRNHDSVRYYPYATYKIERSSKFFDFIDHLDKIGAEVQNRDEKIYGKGYSYSLYGKKIEANLETPLDQIFGKDAHDNCITFAVKALWYLGVLKADKLSDIFNYQPSVAQAVGERAIYKHVHRFAKRYFYLPEWIKMLLDEQGVSNLEVRFPGANNAENRPVRRDHNVSVDCLVKNNVCKALLALDAAKIEKFLPKDECGVAQEQKVAKKSYKSFGSLHLDGIARLFSR